MNSESYINRHVSIKLQIGFVRDGVSSNVLSRAGFIMNGMSTKIRESVTSLGMLLW